MVRNIHIPLVPRSMERYVMKAPPHDEARMHFERYVRMVKPETVQQVNHLRAYGTAFLSASEVDRIIERVADQDDLYG